MDSIEILSLEKFTNGWLVGNFEPAIFRLSECEVGIKRFVKGDIEPCHFQKVAAEYTIVVEGEIRLAGIMAGPGTILRIPPEQHGSFVCIEDCILVVLKTPSMPNDKVLCEGEH